MQINYKTLSKSPGYKSLKAAVLRDVKPGRTCFNLHGCSTKLQCSGDPCFKFRWILDRVAHYSHKTGISPEIILNAWEEDRTYWYQNYYQDSNQPKLDDSVLVIHDPLEFKKKYHHGGYICPACGKISTDHNECTVEPCDWKSYGLFGTLGKGLTIFHPSTARVMNIFMPALYNKSVAGATNKKGDPSRFKEVS